MTKIEWLWTMKKPQVPLAQGLHVIAVPLTRNYWEIKSDLPIKHSKMETLLKWMQIQE